MHKLLNRKKRLTGETEKGGQVTPDQDDLTALDLLDQALVPFDYVGYLQGDRAKGPNPPQLTELFSLDGVGGLSVTPEYPNRRNPWGTGVPQTFVTIRAPRMGVSWVRVSWSRNSVTGTDNGWSISGSWPGLRYRKILDALTGPEPTKVEEVSHTAHRYAVSAMKRVLTDGEGPEYLWPDAASWLAAIPEAAAARVAALPRGWAPENEDPLRPPRGPRESLGAARETVRAVLDEAWPVAGANEGIGIVGSSYWR